MKTKKIGWFEFNWKTTIGKWICSKIGHKKGKYGRCKRCLILMDKSHEPPEQYNCRCSWKLIDEN